MYYLNNQKTMTAILVMWKEVNSRSNDFAMRL